MSSPTLAREMTISDEGLELIASFEGFRAELYNDPAGHATIGYGHLVHLGPIDGSEPAQFKRPLTKAQALDLLRSDAERFVTTVRKAVDVPLTQSRFDALVSFVFNVGGGNFKESTLLRKLNAGDYEGARNEFGKWNKAGGKVLPGLVRRRAAEAAMFAVGSASPDPARPHVSLAMLQRGQRNPQVKTFQVVLRGKGFAHLNPNGPTGFYGDETCAMCKAAQAKNGWVEPDPELPGPRLLQWLGIAVH